MWSLVTAVVAAAAVAPPSADASAAFERGRRLWEQAVDLKGARDALDEAIRLRPDYAEAYLYRALVTSHDHGLAPAKPDFEFALELQPDNKEIHRYYAEVLFDGGALEDAQKHYERALELDPDYGDVLYLLSKVYRKKGEVDKAVKLLERWGEVDPKSSAHHSLGEIFLEKGDDARAAKEFELDLLVDETCYESRINLAGLRLEQGAWQAARDQYETSLTYHPADARALSGLGRAYLKLGDYEKAVGTLRSAQELAPEDEEVAEALVTARRKLKIRYGWPFAVVPGAVALGLAVYVVLGRKRKPTA